MIKIAVLGYGTVGSGVVEVIGQNNTWLRRRAGEEIAVKYILDLRDFPGDLYEDRVVHDFNLILEDAEIGIVCEVMGGVDAAYQYTKQALEAGKSVCTSNKELVAKHGAELLGIARRRHCNYMFEASVGGGIPIIRTIVDSLAAERIESVTGILNGTTNYILSKMETERADYREALAQAQKLGYAERNPEADVEGYDACRKIAILASLITGKNVNCEEIYTEGISGITVSDFAYASRKGMTIKLLAVGSFAQDGRVFCMVAPFMLSRKHPLAGVCDVFNSILVTGNMLGDAMFYGRGAGKLPTASAVAADVVECVRNQGRTVMEGWSTEALEITDMASEKRRFFVRVSASGSKAAEESFWGESGQEAAESLLLGEEAGFLTPVMTEAEFRKKCDALGDIVRGRLRLA